MRRLANSFDWCPLSWHSMEMKWSPRGQLGLLLRSEGEAKADLLLFIWSSGSIHHCESLESPAATTSPSFSTESLSYSPMIDVSREAPQGGAKWSYSIFPIMSRRRSLTLMLFAMLLPAQLLL